jgi:hypothetical protein
VPQNGKKNEKLGVYKSACCGAEIVIGAGATFPHCPNHPRYTIWKLLSDENMTRLTDKKESESKPAA